MSQMISFATDRFAAGELRIRARLRGNRGEGFAQIVLCAYKPEIRRAVEVKLPRDVAEGTAPIVLLSASARS